MDIPLVGVVGAGVMGADLAQALAATGHRVVLVDLTIEILDDARRRILESARLQALFGKAAPGGQAVLDRIAAGTDLAAVREATFVVEAVAEVWQSKSTVHAQLDRLCVPSAVLATTTSAIPVARIAACTQRPDRVIGLHFMNPVPLKPVVEVVCSRHTSPDTLDRARRLLSQMGKECIVVGDSPGFVSNRVLMLAVNEAIALVDEGVAAAGDVDRIFTACLGHKMGPLSTADLIGLDTILLSLNVLHEELDDPKYRATPLLQRMVSAGHLGRKSGRGFFSYQPADVQADPDPKA